MLAFPPGMRLMASPCTMWLEPHWRWMKHDDGQWNDRVQESNKRLLYKTYNIELMNWWIVSFFSQVQFPAQNPRFWCHHSLRFGWFPGCRSFGGRMERCPYCGVTAVGRFGAEPKTCARPNAMRMGINSWGNVLGGKLSGKALMKIERNLTIVDNLLSLNHVLPCLDLGKVCFGQPAAILTTALSWIGVETVSLCWFCSCFRRWWRCVCFHRSWLRGVQLQKDGHGSVAWCS